MQAVNYAMFLTNLLVLGAILCFNTSVKEDGLCVGSVKAHVISASGFLYTGSSKGG